MRKLSVFNSITLDGFFTGENGELGWAHERKDPEWQKFTEDNASGDVVMLFGRKTYDLMVSYWPTPEAAKDLPTVAKAMNKSQKIVFSRTLDKPTWENTKVVKGDIAAAVRELKRERGPGLLIMGSGTIVSQLAQEGLIDEFTFVVVPVVLGKGRTMFETINHRLDLKLTSTRAFKVGNVVNTYEAVR
jgi:dihydrofolate reductase